MKTHIRTKLTKSRQLARLKRAAFEAEMRKDQLPAGFILQYASFTERCLMQDELHRRGLREEVEAQARRHAHLMVAWRIALVLSIFWFVYVLNIILFWTKR